MHELLWLLAPDFRLACLVRRSQFFVQLVIRLPARDAALFCDRLEGFVAREAGLFHFRFEVLLERFGPPNGFRSGLSAIDDYGDFALNPGAGSQEIE